MFKKLLTLACLSALLGFSSVYAQEKEDTAQYEAELPETESMNTIVLRRETKKGAPPVDTAVKVPVDTKPVIIVLPQQTTPPIYIQDQRPVVNQVTPVPVAIPTPAPVAVPAVKKAVAEEEAPKKKMAEIESRPLFFMGIEGGVTKGNYAGSSLRNWQYGYRWTHTNAADTQIMRVYTGYYINHAVSAETGIFVTGTVKGSRQVAGDEFNYDTELRGSGFDFLMRYTSPIGLFVKGGYSYIETVGKSYVEYMPNNVATGDMRWTHGTESALNVAAGVGLDLQLTDHFGLTFTAMHYRTVFSNVRSRMTLFLVGTKFSF